jgi:retinol dehydrogenase-12
MKWKDLQSEKSYDPYKAYAQSKLANVLFTTELARRLKETGVTTVAVHPGFVATELFRDYGDKSCKARLTRPLIKLFSFFFAKDSSVGAATSIFCAIDDSIPFKNGCYFA